MIRVFIYQYKEQTAVAFFSAIQRYYFRMFLMSSAKDVYTDKMLLTLKMYF